MSLATMATATASTKRALVTGGKRGLPQAYLNNIACTPLQPAATDTIQRLKLDTLVQIFATIVPGISDIMNTDVLVVNGQDYVVRDVSPWSMPVTGETFMNVTVERLAP